MFCYKLKTTYFIKKTWKFTDEIELKYMCSADIPSIENVITQTFKILNERFAPIRLIEFIQGNIQLTNN